MNIAEVTYHAAPVKSSKLLLPKMVPSFLANLHLDLIFSLICQIGHLSGPGFCLNSGCGAWQWFLIKLLSCEWDSTGGHCHMAAVRDLQSRELSGGQHHSAHWQHSLLGNWQGLWAVKVPYPNHCPG